MRKNVIAASTTAMLCILLTATGTLLPGGTAWGVVGPPALFNTPLNQIAVPEPPNLFQFVKNKNAAIKLGKALFWEMQAGSDGVQACGSCHFSAGADNRIKNTVNPGTRGNDNTFQVRGPNETLLPTDFPFHQRDLPDFKISTVIRDFNDIVGSQGVKLTDFLAINALTGEETGTAVADQVFHVGAAAPANNTRRVTARNTPSNINAIFNFHNFWDGRAHFIFNGVNPFGPLDTAARIRVNTGTALLPSLQLQKIEIENASMASQATGPPLDDTEMSASGRTFPELGRKLLKLRPLGKQFVHPNDSVLGPFSRALLQPDGKLGGTPGLSDATTYAQMIKDAFVNNLWDSAPQNINLPTKAFPVGEAFNQMEANFSLFWGLAIQLYEATLVSDQTPFDRLLGGDQNALNTPSLAGAVDGMNIFFGAGKCDICHAGTELTSASVRAALFITNNNNALIEQMPVASGLNTIYDLGFNDTAVRRITDDIGRGGKSPILNPLTNLFTPLSYCSLAQIQQTGNLPFLSAILPNANLAAPFPISNDGAFKVPGLRNVELTAPYFHDGGVMTLVDVVDFYTRGGNFPAANINHLDFNITEIGALQNKPIATANLVAFMRSLTDERVRNQSAPFDHPELFIPNGLNSTDPDVLTRIPAKGADGAVGLPSNFKINPAASPTNKTNQLISGTKDAGATIQVQVNSVAAPVTGAPVDTIWSATVSLLEENNVISVTSVETTGTTTLNVNIILDTVVPALNLNAVATPSRNGSQIISGTVEAGIIPLVKVGTTATVGTVTAVGGSWNAQLSLLVTGPNAVTVTATDAAGNVTTQTASIQVLGDGIFNGTRIPDISDALRALRMAVGLITPTPDDLLHGDVAPLGAPDGKIDISDALLIMRNVVGTIALIN